MADSMTFEIKNDGFDDFRNSKWRIQYGGQKFEKSLDFAENLTN